MVQHQKMPVVEYFGDFPKDAMFDLPCFPVYDHESRLVALGEGMLCDEMLREVEIKGAELHRSIYSAIEWKRANPCFGGLLLAGLSTLGGFL